jgi:hypothetical protein
MDLGYNALKSFTFSFASYILGVFMYLGIL